MQVLNKIIPEKIPVPVLVFSFLYLLVILAGSRIPLFWDMSYISQISTMIYDSNFSVYYSDALDDGSSPLYGLYLASLWGIAGKTLLISHLAVFPFVVGIVYQFSLLLKRFLGNRYVYLAFFLLLIEPTLITQTILSGYDLAICFLFLFAMNGIFSNRRWPVLIAAAIIPLINIRGFSIVISIFITDLFIHKEFTKSSISFLKNFFPYFISLLFLLSWMLWHRYLTGWLFLSHSRGASHQLAGIEGMARNLVYTFWKMLDFGRVFIFCVILILSFKIKLKDNPLFAIILFSIIPFLLIFTPFSYPASHRHFMHIYPLLIILFLFLLERQGKKSLTIIVTTLAFIFLLTGNLWLYPERFGNGWDSSLKCIPYFGLKKQLDEYVTVSKINPSDVGAKWPMNFDRYDTWPGKPHFSYSDFDSLSVSEFSYVAQSNISNKFTAAEIRELNEEWILEKEFRAWPVYIKLFRNP